MAVGGSTELFGCTRGGKFRMQKFKNNSCNRIESDNQAGDVGMLVSMRVKTVHDCFLKTRWRSMSCNHVGACYKPHNSKIPPYFPRDNALTIAACRLHAPEATALPSAKSTAKIH